MAGVSRAPSLPVLFGLEEELTCSICLCLFESPVTTPCGHNFCLPCLEMTWAPGKAPGESFSCPQCRTHFHSRPELKKNTVLCRVVEQFEREPAKEEPGPKTVEKKAPQESPVPCDSCLGAQAAQTCLSCMASFCQEHLRPHLESPAFKGHHLVTPVRDLHHKKCPDHGKLLEFHCQDHGGCICCFCLVTHKACDTIPLAQAKEEKEMQLKKRLTELYTLNEKALQSLDQVRSQQKQTSDTASRKLDLLKSEFQEIKALIQEEEEESVKKVLAEKQRVLDKYDFVYKVLGKKKSEIQGERDQIEMALSAGDDIAFLTKATKLRPMQIKDVFIPKIELDQKVIHAVYQKSFGLKENVKQYLTQPEEKKTEGSSQPKPLQHGKKNPGSNASKQDSIPLKTSVEMASKEANAASSTAAASNTAETKQRRRPAKRAQSPNQRARSSSRTVLGIQSVTPETFVGKSREELLEFAATFCLDFNTAHKKVVLSEKNTKMSVSEIPQNYSHHPQRFSYCSQVLGFQCFKRGIHYWEVEMEHNNFCGIGICYGTMPRQGAESRLGRNSSSWCIEWFNARISAWHNDIEKCLPNTKVQKIGVLLNYEGGFVIFFGVAEKMILLYKFRAQFTEALYPAFWVFSSGTTISICQLK
ncbi:E3 ubiquitin/ISG15 ligase TRIM25 [Anolis carolinensis]|uniref:E3 ubiquitin/ISG15 ligase TRIM25 n=1 Tax=Anolis carolinensis TaxID=28377 RepID=UPI002F2B4BAD